jgi:predicted ester cyclase
MEEQNRRALEEAVRRFAPATLEEYLELYSEDAVLHFLPPGLPRGRAGARLFYGAFFAAFPDAMLVLDDMFARGDKMAARFSISATHRGPFLGVAPSGRRVSFSGITIFRFEEGRVVERWSETNLWAVLNAPAS